MDQGESEKRSEPETGRASEPNEKADNPEGTLDGSENTQVPGDSNEIPAATLEAMKTGHHSATRMRAKKRGMEILIPLSRMVIQVSCLWYAFVFL